MLTSNIVGARALCWECFRLEWIWVLKRDVESERDVVAKLHEWKSFSTSLGELLVYRVILNVYYINYFLGERIHPL